MPLSAVARDVVSHQEYDAEICTHDAATEEVRVTAARRAGRAGLCNPELSGRLCASCPKGRLLDCVTATVRAVDRLGSGRGDRGAPQSSWSSTRRSSSCPSSSGGGREWPPHTCGHTSRGFCNRLPTGLLREEVDSDSKSGCSGSSVTSPVYHVAVESGPQRLAGAIRAANTQGRAALMVCLPSDDSVEWLLEAARVSVAAGADLLEFQVRAPYHPSSTVDAVRAVASYV